MSMVVYLGKDVKEYNENAKEMVKKYIEEGKILCAQSLEAMKLHLYYTRGIKETGEEIKIAFVRCTACDVKHGDALLPDFIVPHKHYSGNEIESVIIDSATRSVSEIDTEASESTVRRWIAGVGKGIVRAVSILKTIFIAVGKISEIEIEPGNSYSELEQVLEMSRQKLRYSGNKLGLANIWLSRHNRVSYI